MGLSVDLGLLGNTQCTPQHSLALWLFLLRLIPSILLWFAGMIALRCAFFLPGKARRNKQRLMSHRIFGFLLSSENFYEHENGFLNRLQRLSQRPLDVINLSQIGQSLLLACKRMDRIPSGQDIIFLHLGAMDYINNVKCLTFRASLRELLQRIGQKNPEGHVIFLGPPDLVTILSTPLNHRKALPLPFAPTISDLHRWEGFHKHLGLTADSTPEERAHAHRLLSIFVQLMKHELNRARNRGVIRNFTFIDGRATPIFQAEDRSRYFALDGMHLTAEAVDVAVAFAWPMIMRDLESLAQPAPAQRDQEAARTVGQAFPAPASAVNPI
jgi:hypothetical protein